MLFNLEEHEVEETLTQRQKEYFAAYKQGGTTTDAAVIMGVSYDTASSQLRTIAKKLGFSDIRDTIQKRERKEKATASELMSLLKKQHYKCALSGLDLTPETANLDHIVPRKNGGSDSICNLQWLATEVNRMKGTMEQEQFVKICGEVWRNNASPPMS